jgi:predicted Rossmann fold nucleotide-binding protein DprA/Smf involved in DNA uptake
MNISKQAQAVLLITTWFTKPAKNDPKPLSPTEWGRFALWLKEARISPETLMTSNHPMNCLNGWSDRTVTSDRICNLLDRSAALGLALEKWQRAGLWVMTRSDEDYPFRLKSRLKYDAPPVLFGCGNRQLLDRGGIAVVGSRDATEGDLGCASMLGGEMASQGYSVVSGGARGVDEAAMLGALEKEGTVIGVLPDNLLRDATSARYRKGLMAKNLVLVSPYNPEAGFNIGNAMARNKYIYCLSDAAVVVATSKDKGGTWSGAIEDLKRGWVPLWVKHHPDQDSGNAALVNQGARWLPSARILVSSLLAPGEPPKTHPAEPGLFDTKITVSAPILVREPPPQPEYDIPIVSIDYKGTKVEPISAEPKQLPVRVVLDSLTFYELFLHQFDVVTAGAPISTDTLIEKLGICRTQLTEWLKRGMEEGKIKKINKKPVRFQSTEAGQKSLGF